VVGLADTAGYVAAKHGVIGLTKTAALDCVSRGIRVNALAPGFVDTPLLDRALEGGSKRRRSSGAALLTPMGRLATVDEVTEVALFLLSDRSSVVTGSVYLADGGYAAR
jgi:NAD(P)-dependent dehydrogenase (short-subunit alcohol dehydrogenase family)